MNPDRSVYCSFGSNLILVHIICCIGYQREMQTTKIVTGGKGLIFFNLIQGLNDSGVYST